MSDKSNVSNLNCPTSIFPTHCALFTTFCKRDPLFSTLWRTPSPKTPGVGVPEVPPVSTTTTTTTTANSSNLKSANRGASPNHNRIPARTRKPTPKQKNLSGKSTHQYAHHRIASSMGLDHRSINIAFARATQPPGRTNASDAALTAAAAFVLSSVFRMTRMIEIVWGA
jgi:hypothetical protein